MNGQQHSRIVSFIWNIADDVLRDLYVRGKYRDVILPMTVLRRLDAVLEPTQRAVLDTKATLDNMGITHQDLALRQAAGQAFYNTSPFTLRDLRARTTQQQLKDDFEAYLDAFSSNVQDILENFEFRHQIPRLSKADALGSLIEKFLDPTINLSPYPVLNLDGTEKHAGLDNHAMGTIFEELVRRFNEENNEEAGEHWTPRDAVRLMARLVFLPIADKVESGTYLLYDGACGTGGMLTVGEEALQEIAAQHGKQVATHLYGQEINGETYAICKADLLLKGEGEAADNIVGGPEHSTLSNDAFPLREFDFMLSNPPYGKSWKSDLERMGGRSSIKDPRFVIQHGGDPEYSLVTRSNDGQMLFLANMVSKMKIKTALGSRLAEVHNGSSLFTGGAGQGESNIRRWIIENDWLEAIVGLPSNMFYNTPIATYVWIISNRKPEHRRGKVQLIDASRWFKPMRKHLGKKSSELGDDDIDRICGEFLAFEETGASRILSNESLGYWKLSVERPLRAVGVDAARAYNAKEVKSLRDIGQIDPSGDPIVRRIYSASTINADPLRGRFERLVAGSRVIAEYEPDPQLRSSAQVWLDEPGGIDGFIVRELLPFMPDAWIDSTRTIIGYEVSFNRYFSEPRATRSLDEVEADIDATERATEGLIADIRKTVARGGRIRSYKESGQPWLGDIPQQWELVPLRALVRPRKQLVGEAADQFTLLSLTLRGIIPRDMDNPQGKFPAEFSTYQVVEPGDLVFCLFDVDETPRTVGYSSHHGMITGAYTVFEPIDATLAEFLYLFFLGMDEHKRLRPLYTGLRKVISMDVLLSLKVPIPPESERVAIVKVLKAEALRIEGAIGGIARQIDLLEQYRGLLVRDAVTGRVDFRDIAQDLPDREISVEAIGAPADARKSDTGNEYSPSDGAT